MALADKKYTELYASSKKTNIESVHSEGLLSHMIDNPEDDPHLTSVLKELKDLQDELDTLRTEISSNKDKVTFPGLGTSSTTALAGDTNIVTIGSSTTIAFGDMITVPAKGKTPASYSIVMTVTNGGVSKAITLTLT
tara:strand:- start:366 stop:776 length:411 start_codon:yes stop_codon:yes gene_type:complete